MACWTGWAGRFPITAPAQPEPEIRRRLALIIEDSPAERDLLSALAREYGLFAVYATDAASALAAAQGRRPDVILLDIWLPGDGGLALLARIREEHPFVPVVVVTSNQSGEHVENALNLGAVNFLRKPLRADEFRFVLDRIDRVLAEEEDLQEALFAVTERQTRMSLPCDSTLLTRVVALLGREARNHYPGHALPLPDLKLALYEALVNAVEHGNLEIGFQGKSEALMASNGFQELVAKRRKMPHFASRRVHIEATYFPDSIEYRIRDEGPGFDPSRYDAMRSLQDATSLHGRGLALIHHYMDEVSWNGVGNEIRMRRRLAPRPIVLQTQKDG